MATSCGCSRIIAGTRNGRIAKDEVPFSSWLRKRGAIFPDFPRVELEACTGRVKEWTEMRVMPVLCHFRRVRSPEVTKSRSGGYQIARHGGLAVFAPTMYDSFQKEVGGDATPTRAGLYQPRDLRTIPAKDLWIRPVKISN